MKSLINTIISIALSTLLVKADGGDPGSAIPPKHQID